MKLRRNSSTWPQVLKKIKLVNAAERGAGARIEDNYDTDGWVDKMEELDAEEHAMLEEHVQPVWLVLVKVRQINCTYQITPNCLSQLHKLAYKLIPSTMKLLTLWNEYLKRVKLST